MRFLFVVHKNEEKAEQNSVLFHRLTLKERGLRPNGYFPLMRQPPSVFIILERRNAGFFVHRIEMRRKNRLWLGGCRRVPRAEALHS